jgi:predicted DNA-binding protein
MKKKKVQRNFRPWPKNQERLEYADEKLGFNVSELINEILETHLKSHIEAKTKKLREALSTPIP